MATARNETTIHRGKGATGLPNRVTAVRVGGQGDAIDVLAERGCCAWVGRSACGEPATHVMRGGPWLKIVLYRTAMLPGVAELPQIGVVCARHAAGPRELVRDYPQDLFESQAELHRALFGTSGRSIAIAPFARARRGRNGS